MDLADHGVCELPRYQARVPTQGARATSHHGGWRNPYPRSLSTWTTVRCLGTKTCQLPSQATQGGSSSASLATAVDAGDEEPEAGEDDAGWDEGECQESEAGEESDPVIEAGA